MATTKKTTTSKSTTVAAAFPAKTAQAPAVVARAGKLLAAAADGVPGAGTKKETPKRTIGDKLNAADRAKKKDVLTVLADQTTAKKAAAKKAPAKARSAAAKRAEPTGTKKVATKSAKPATAQSGVPVREARTLGQLQKILATMPTSATWDVDRKFGKPAILVNNMRGRLIHEIHVLAK